MASTLLLAFLSLTAVVMAAPAVEDWTNTVSENSVFDLKALQDAVAQMQFALDKFNLLLEETARSVSDLTPHVIHKRQTSVKGNVNNGPGGTRGSVGVTHQRGGTTFEGNVDFGRGGTGWGVGVNHRGSNGWNVGGSFGRQPGSGSSGRVDFGRTWNGGRTNFGGYVGRGGGGNSAGISFSHKFRK